MTKQINAYKSSSGHIFETMAEADRDEVAEATMRTPAGLSAQGSILVP